MRHLIAILCALALVAAQALYGGVLRPVFALPCYMILGVAGVLSLAILFQRNTPLPSLSCILSTLGLAAWLLWRSSWSPDPWVAAPYERLIVACLVMYLIFACAVVNPRARMTFVAILLVSAMVQSAVGAWQFVNRHDTMPLPWMSEYLKAAYATRLNGRAHGFYLNANHLAWFLNAAWAFALPVAIWSRFGIKTKLIVFYLALVSLIAALFTVSRGGVIALVFGLAVFAILSAYVLLIGARGRRPLALFVLCLGLVVTGAVAVNIYGRSFTAQDRFSRLLEDDFRPRVSNAALRQFQQEPFFGTGAGTFLYYGRQYRETLSFHDDIFAHNDWMQFTGDFGFPALALLIITLLLHLGSGLQSFTYVLKERMFLGSKPQSDAAALLLAAFVALAMFSIHSLFDFNMQLPANALLAAACLGIIANAGVERETKPRRWLRVSYRWTSGLLIVSTGIFLLYLTLKALPAEVAWLKAENSLYERDWESAIAYAQDGIDAGAIHPRLYRAVGEGYIGMVDSHSDLKNRWTQLQAAVGAFTRSVQLAPLDYETRFRLADALGRVGLYRQAEEEAQEAIRLSPVQGYPYAVYASILAKSGRLEELQEAERLYGCYNALPRPASRDEEIKELRQRIEDKLGR